MTYEEAVTVLGPDVVAALPAPEPLTDAQLERLAALFAAAEPAQLDHTA